MSQYFFPTILVLVNMQHEQAVQFFFVGSSKLKYVMINWSFSGLFSPFSPFTSVLNCKTSGRFCHCVTSAVQINILLQTCGRALLLQVLSDIKSGFSYLYQLCKWPCDAITKNQVIAMSRPVSFNLRLKIQLACHVVCRSLLYANFFHVSRQQNFKRLVLVSQFLLLVQCSVQFIMCTEVKAFLACYLVSRNYNSL